MYRVINKRELVKRLFLYFVPLALIGVLIGAPFLLLLCGTSALLYWHYRQLYKLSDWLLNQRSFNPPEGEGSWEQIFEGIYRLQHRHRKKRNELADLIRRFREGSEAVPDGVVVLQFDLSIVWSNKIGLRLLGLKWPMDHGQRLDNLVRHPKFVDYMHEHNFDKPLELQSPINSEQELEFRVMPYANSQLMLVVRDVTLIKQLEQMRKDFVANVSHELRTPLTVVTGYLEMMDEDNLPPPALWAKAQKTMLEQCQRMDSLVNQLLALARIENSTDTESNKQINVEKMLHLIRHEADRLNQEKGHQINFKVTPNLHLLGDEDELRSAFSNLIFNAIHYTPNGGEIEISWQRTGANCAEFKVTDNGDGIAPEHIHRLTERFYRVDQARSRKTGGSGLGLAITKHVLSRHNSVLQISSVVGEGACFSFSFDARRVVELESES